MKTIIMTREEYSKYQMGSNEGFKIGAGKGLVDRTLAYIYRKDWAFQQGVYDGMVIGAEFSKHKEEADIYTMRYKK